LNDIEVYEYDSLTYEERWGDNFDVILANPPFMTPKGGIRPHKLFQVSANRAEVLFVDYIAEHLTIHGKAGIIVPEGIVFHSANAYKALRKMLIDEHYLYAVVSLPAGVFQPYSGVKTSILFLDKQLAKKNDEIIFVKVENDGFDLGAQRRRINKNDLSQAFEILQKWQKVEKTESRLALWVKKEKIAESGDYNLTGDRYKEAVDYSKVKWPMVKLGDVAEVVSGQSPQGKYYNEKGEGVPFYQGKTEFTERVIDPPKKWTTQTTKIAVPNDILMSVRAPVGPVNFTMQKICIGRGLAAIRCDTKKINHSYLFFLLREKESEIQGNKGAAFSSINKNDIQQIQIPLPPLEVQKEIVAELGSYQKVIDGARQVAENWKPRIKINPDWPMVELGQVCNVISGYSFSSKDFSIGNSVKVIKITNAGVKEFIDEESAKLPEDYLNKHSGFIANTGDIIISLTRSIVSTGLKVCMVPKHWNNSLVNQRVALIKEKREVDIIFIYTYLLSDNMYLYVEEKSKSLMQPNLSINDLKQLPIPFPPLETQKQIVTKIEKEQKMVDECKKLIAIHEQKIKDKIAEVWGE